MSRLTEFIKRLVKRIGLWIKRNHNAAASSFLATAIFLLLMAINPDVNLRTLGVLGLISAIILFPIGILLSLILQSRTLNDTIHLSSKNICLIRHHKKPHIIATADSIADYTKDIKRRYRTALADLFTPVYIR